MKKFILVLLVLTCVFFYGCDKEESEQGEAENDDKNLVELYYTPIDIYNDALEVIEDYNDKVEQREDAYNNIN